MIDQFARPTADSATGSWTTAPLWSKVDEVVADDADEISSETLGATGNTTIAKLTVNATIDPVTGLGHFIWVRAKATFTVGASAGIRAELRQSGTLIATLSNDTLTTSYATFSYVLTAAEANAISDYSALELWLYGVFPVGSLGSVQVSWTQFEVPALMPQTIGGIVEAWVASDLALADTTAISAWIGRVTGSSLSQATGTKQPLYRTTGINSQPAVDFDGTDDLVRASTQHPTSQSGSVFVVVLADALPSAPDGTIWSTADEASGNRYVYGSLLSGGKLQLQESNNDTADNVQGGITLSTATKYLLEFTSTGSSYIVRLNGISEALTVTGGANNGDWFGDVTGLDNFTVGGWKGNSEAEFFNGKIAAVVVIDGAIGEADRFSLYSWVQDTYGIVLPSPYVFHANPYRYHALPQPRRAKLRTPVPAQVVVVNPAFVPSRRQQRVLRGYLFRRGRQTLAWPQAPLNTVLPNFTVNQPHIRRLYRPTRGRVSTPVPKQLNPTFLFSQIRATLRPRYLLRRGRSSFPFLQQSPPPPSFIPQDVMRRVQRIYTKARGRISFPVQPQQPIFSFSRSQRRRSWVPRIFRGRFRQFIKTNPVLISVTVIEPVSGVLETSGETTGLLDDSGLRTSVLDASGETTGVLVS